MDFLWEKEASSGLYVDLFDENDVPESLQNEFDIFDKIKTKVIANQEYHFLAKDNKKSLAFRALGNDFFSKKNFTEAMKLYNKSLCFAENGTENISLAYANRSSCFLHMKMYAKCLADIELAIKANYPEKLMPKLLKRQKDCKDSLQNGSIDASYINYPALSYEEDPKFPGMANTLEIKRHKKFGRHVVAKCNIPAGQTVLIEKALFSTSSDHYHCHDCLKTAMNFVPCEHCSWGLFCHNSCENEHEMHQMECGESLIGMWELEEKELDVATEFLSVQRKFTDHFEVLDFLKHSLLKILKSFPNVESLIEFVEDTVASKSSNVPDRLDDVKSKYLALLQLNRATPNLDRKILCIIQTNHTYNYLLLRDDIKTKFNTEQKRRFLMHFILHQILVIFLNGFSTDDGRKNAFVLSSYFNHGCASNLRCISRANMRFGVTLRPIKAGQQLFISYLSDVFGDTTVEETQEKMQENFGFQCSKCERCKPNELLWLKNSNLLQQDTDYLFLSHKSSQWRKTNDGRSEKEKQKILKEMTLNVLNRFGSGHWCEELANMMEYYDNFLFDNDIY